MKIVIHISFYALYKAGSALTDTLPIQHGSNRHLYKVQILLQALKQDSDFCQK